MQTRQNTMAKSRLKNRQPLAAKFRRKEYLKVNTRQSNTRRTTFQPPVKQRRKAVTIMWLFLTAPKTRCTVFKRTLATKWTRKLTDLLRSSEWHKTSTKLWKILSITSKRNLWRAALAQTKPKGSWHRSWQTESMTIKMMLMGRESARSDPERALKTVVFSRWLNRYSNPLNLPRKMPWIHLRSVKSCTLASNSSPRPSSKTCPSNRHTKRWEMTIRKPLKSSCALSWKRLQWRYTNTFGPPLETIRRKSAPFSNPLSIWMLSSRSTECQMRFSLRWMISVNDSGISQNKLFWPLLTNFARFLLPIRVLEIVLNKELQHRRGQTRQTREKLNSNSWRAKKVSKISFWTLSEWLCIWVPVEFLRSPSFRKSLKETPMSLKITLGSLACISNQFRTLMKSLVRSLTTSRYRSGELEDSKNPRKMDKLKLTKKQRK